MLDVEAALARAEARAGVIPQAAADAIGRAASARDFDAAALAREARASGTVAVPLVAVLTERVRAFDEDAARFVHWGATSQDIVDTSLVLLVNRAAAVLSTDHARLVERASHDFRSACGRRDARPDPAPACTADHVRAQGGRLAGGREP